MATVREMKDFLDNAYVDLEIEETIQAIQYDKIDTIEPARDTKEFLLKNARVFDLKKLMAVVIVKCGENNSEEKWRKSVQYAKRFIKPDENVYILITYKDDDKIGDKVKIVNTKQIVFGKFSENENNNYDKIKELLPDVEKKDLMLLYDVFQQMIDEPYITKMIFTGLLESTFYNQGYSLEQISKYSEGKTVADLDKVVKKMSYDIEAKDFNLEFKKTLEEIKGVIKESYYILFHIYRIQQKLEKNEKLEEKEKKFLANLTDLEKDINISGKIRINDKATYGTEDVKKLLSQIDIKTKEYIPENQLKNGKRLLSDLNGYEEHLKKAEIMELAKIDKNLIYLFQKRKISKKDVDNILKTVEVSEDTIVELYCMQGITQEQLQNFATKNKIDIELLKEKIKQKRPIDKKDIKLDDKNTWFLLNREEKIEAFAEMIHQNQKEIHTDEAKKEALELCKTDYIAELYRDIYIKGESYKQAEYKRLITIYNWCGNQDKEEIITLLEDELSNEMLINLYSDNLISIYLLESYGEKELVQETFNEGKIHNKDIEYVLTTNPIELPEEQIVKLYNNKNITPQNIILLYLQGKIKLNVLQKLDEGLAENITQEQLIKYYKKSKRTKNDLEYKKYTLLYQAFRNDNLDEIVLEEKGLKQDDIIRLYRDNLITINALKTYGQEGLIQELTIDGILKPNDAKKIYRETGEKEEIIKILKNSEMDDIQKIILIYSTFEDDKETRDKLIKYIKIDEDNIRKNEEDYTSKRQQGEKKETKEKISKSITDPYERWKFFASLDKNYAKDYLDGYLIVNLTNSQKTIVEKMYQKKKNEILPAYGTATFIMDTETYIEKEDKILQDGKLNIVALREIAKEEPDKIAKITHHPPKKGIEQKGNWGKRILRYIGTQKMDKIYSKEDKEEIEKCIRDIEASREEWDR